MSVPGTNHTQALEMSKNGLNRDSTACTRLVPGLYRESTQSLHLNFTRTRTLPGFTRILPGLPGKILVNPGKVLVLVKFRDLVQAWYKPGDGKKVYKIAFFDISKVVLCQQLGTLYEVFVSVYLDMNEDDKKDHVHHSSMVLNWP
ncbi:hypothetical protein JOM56_014442 [Amanita muscaria]